MLADGYVRDTTCFYRTNMVARDKIPAFFIATGISLRVRNDAIYIRHTFTCCPLIFFPVSTALMSYVGTGQLIAIR
jgi:hypothetical protein